MNNNVHLPALRILSGATNVPVEKLQQALAVKEYKKFFKPKKRGGKREINAPIGNTREVQDALYGNFLQKLSSHHMIGSYNFGGIKKKSHILNAKRHCSILPKMFINIDLQNAFHCIDKNTLREILYDLFQEEIFLYRFSYYDYLLSFRYREYQKNREDNGFEPENIDAESLIDQYLDARNHYRCSRHKILYSPRMKGSMSKYIRRKPPLFPAKKVKWFRMLVKNLDSFGLVDELCEEMARILSEVLTYEGRVVQGCPTSMILMSLAVSHTNLLKFFEELTGSNYSISIFVDDITLGISGWSSKKKLHKRLEEILDYTEQQTIWRFNKKKTRIYDPSKEDASITGFRILRNRKTRQELKYMKDMGIKGASRCLRHWNPWWYGKLTIPKDLQSKIRSSLHHACQEREDKKVQSRARSYIGYVFQVYEDYHDIPKQIQKKLDGYIQLIDPDLVIRYRIKKAYKIKQ